MFLLNPPFLPFSLHHAFLSAFFFLSSTFSPSCPSLNVSLPLHAVPSFLHVCGVWWDCSRWIWSSTWVSFFTDCVRIGTLTHTQKNVLPSCVCVCLCVCECASASVSACVHGQACVHACVCVYAAVGLCHFPQKENTWEHYHHRLSLSLSLSLSFSLSLSLPLHFSPFSLAPSPPSFSFFFFLKAQGQSNGAGRKSGGGRHSYQKHTLLSALPQTVIKFVLFFNQINSCNFLKADDELKNKFAALFCVCT